jgi:hypothetical protein
MTRKDKGKFAEKYPAERKTDPAAVKAVKAGSEYGVIPCAAAMNVAEQLGVPSEEVGFTIDKLEIRISKCQLGLFGNTPISKIVRAEENISPELEQAIREVLVDNRLSCKSAWELSKRFKIPRIRISGACEALNIKISGCQLNAF